MLLNVFRAGSSTAVVDGAVILPVLPDKGGFPMKRLIPSSIAIAALAGLLVATEVAEAGKIRSPVERRLRPGRGFWENSSPSQVRSYNGYSNGTRYSTPQPRYVAPQPRYSTPQPRYVMPQRQYTPYRYYVQPPTYVQQPRVTEPVQAETSTPKKNEASRESQTGE